MAVSKQLISPRPYFASYEHRAPMPRPALPTLVEQTWQICAVISLCLGTSYIYWRLTDSFNEQAPIFSIAVMAAELLAFVGLCLFYFDIWAEGDTIEHDLPSGARDVGIGEDRPIAVDILITTFDEPVEVLSLTIQDALNVEDGAGFETSVYVLDDGHRSEIADLSALYGVKYLTRNNNRGYKAGNLREALFSTDGDFILICDADTRLLPPFVKNTLGYFKDPQVSWVQTPHWFYDLPSGHTLRREIRRLFPRTARTLGKLGLLPNFQIRFGSDPFMNNPDFFFDVIQRRRNRNFSSFCCGAGSIHRRSALLEVALSDQAVAAAKVQRQINTDNPKAVLRLAESRPFQFHVSEDLFTSIRHQRRGWKSVFHPQIEAKMLSPRTISSWTLQRMKYAGGTYDIMARANPIFMKNVNWRTKLHYLSTFWSYLSVFWIPILLLSPAISLLTGWSPVQAYSLQFFLHLVPFLVFHEIAVMITSKGHDVNLGRSMMVGLLPMHFKAGWNVIRGRKPTFVPTPKIPVGNDGQSHLLPHFMLLFFFAFSACIGLFQHQNSVDGYSTAFLTTNLLWLSWNFAIVWRTAKILLWQKVQSSSPKG